MDTVNFSHNFISTIENCGSDVLPELSTLNISHNRLATAADLAALTTCLTVSTLDMSHNRIDDILFVGILAAMPELRVLNMTGNPVISKIPSYRKTLINECVNKKFNIKSVRLLMAVYFLETIDLSG